MIILLFPALTETDDAYILDVDLGKDSITEIFEIISYLPSLSESLIFIPNFAVMRSFF